MSELEARKYTSIRNLREEIRRNMEDINLLRGTVHYIDDMNFNFYKKYLLNRINTNIELLINKEQNNE
jgi:hypothetical protein